MMDIFEHKYLNNGLFLNCQRNMITIEMQKVFFINNIRMNTLKIGDSHRVIKNSLSRLGIFVNTSCDGWNDYVNNMNVTDKFQFPCTWIFITDDIATTVNVLSNFSLGIDSDVTIVDKDDLYDVYNTGFKNNGRLIVTKYAPRNKVIKVRERENRNDLSDVQLKCAVVVISNTVIENIEQYIKNESETKMLDSIHRLKYLTVLEYLKDMYNFT